jgi:hypothetical protein
VARRPPDPAGRGASEQRLDEALARARRHAKNALAEGLAAARALLDAASLATSGATAGDHPVFAVADAWISDASRSLTQTRGVPGDLGAALADALDAEIQRWEQRALADDDARSVLRAFLGLREMLWEVGVRPATPPTRSSRRMVPAEPNPEPENKPRPRRVEHVSVQG